MLILVPPRNRPCPAAQCPMSCVLLHRAGDVGLDIRRKARTGCCFQGWNKSSPSRCAVILWIGQRNPAPVENDGKNPMILFGFQPSKVMQDFATIHSMFQPIPTIKNGHDITTENWKCSPCRRHMLNAHGQQNRKLFGVLGKVNDQKSHIFSLAK